MNLSGRPLLDNPADQALFVGRDAELHRIERAVRSGLNCLVVGDPGSGKTSLMRAFLYRADEAGDLGVVYVRGSAAQTAADLLRAVLAAVSRGSSDGGDVGATVKTANPADLVDRLVNAVGDGTATVIIVDDVPADAGLELFGALRDELWQIDARWLVTASTAQAAALLRPPADVFFETRVHLEPMAEPDIEQMLRRRLDRPDDADSRALIAAVRQAGSLTPRRVLEVARDVATEPTVGVGRLTTVQGLRERTAALERMSRPAQMLAAELESLGWASASDERLLGRMGWTRPRVVQVIGELERGGLVQMREENTGRGRPRKLFRLVPAAEFDGSEQP
jgi:type II secretory pathway predicted ATPase ExeA